MLMMSALPSAMACSAMVAESNHGKKGDRLNRRRQMRELAGIVIIARPMGPAGPPARHDALPHVEVVAAAVSGEKPCNLE
jgi:hypothetical protein